MSDKRPAPTNVYVMSAEFGPVKIGASKHPQKRASHVRWTRDGPFLTVRAIYPRPDDAMKIEHAAHKLLVDVRVEREWFNCSVEQAKWAIEAAIAAKDAKR